MKRRRLPKMARWLASIYLAWSVLVFFGSMGSDSHSWWPIFVYPIIWPLSMIFEHVGSAFADKIQPVFYDYVAGAFYIGVGTTWIWWLGHLTSIVATRLFPIRDE
jgi:hypothetical protein